MIQKGSDPNCIIFTQKQHLSMKKIINPWIGTEGYNCFVCCPTNPIGLHLEFWEDGDYIVTKFHPTHDYESWQNTLHGGIQALLIDETAGWVVCRKLHITKMMRNVAFIEAELMDADNTVLTHAELIYFCTPKFKLDEKAFPSTGCKVEGE